MGEPNADVPPEVAGSDSKQEEPAATADQDPVPGLAATEDVAEGTNGVAAGDETMVDEVNLVGLCVENIGGLADALAAHGVILLGGARSLLFR